MTAKRTKAAKVLARASLYLMSRYNETERARAILDEAERMVRCGYRTLITYESLGLDANPLGWQGITVQD